MSTSLSPMLAAVAAPAPDAVSPFSVPRRPRSACTGKVTQEGLSRMSELFDALCRVNPGLAGVSFRRDDGGGSVFYSFGRRYDA